MEELYSVSFAKVIDQFHLETIYLPALPEDIKITCARVNRPGLQLAGFYDHYEPSRMQIIGKTENLFISQMDPEEKTRRLEDYFRSKPVGVIVTSSIEIDPKTVDIAEKYEVPLLRTSERTSEFMAALISFLNVELGPRITRHGVLVEVYGEGILLLGDSGIGKSETAIELVKRGHRLIADDAVEIKVTDGYVDAEVVTEKTAPFETVLEVKVPLADGNKMTLVDYSSAGKTWSEESKMAAWILTK